MDAALHAAAGGASTPFAVLAALALAVVLASLAAAAVVAAIRRRAAPAIVARDPMTRSEVAFMRKLVPAARRHGLHVCPQVSMGALLATRPGMERREAWGVRARFQSKVVDFALIDGDGRVRLIVELDDPTHATRRDADRARDAMTAGAGYRTLRVPDGRASGVDGLAADIGRMAGAEPDGLANRADAGIVGRRATTGRAGG